MSGQAKTDLSRRALLRASASLPALGIAGHAAAASHTASAGSNAPTTSSVAITGGSQTTFPSAAAPGSSDGGFNILFILTDQEHYMGPGWPIPLPGHERLKRTGTFFENHHIAANMCSASRAVIYTGLHMPHNGIFDNAGVPYMKSLSPDLPTIGKILRKMGYYTAYKGKWHLNGAMADENKPDHIRALFESMMDRDYGFFDYTGLGDFIEGALGGYQYDAITGAQAAQWLKAKGRPMTSRGQPWYLAVNLVNPHDVMWVNTDPPGSPPAQAKGAMLDIAFPPDDRQYRQSWDQVPLQSTWQQALDAPGRPAAHRIYHDANAVLTGMIPNEPNRLRARQNYYLNAIQEADRQVSLVLDQLDNLGLTDKTIVIFTSDHGELLGSHGGLSGKGTTAYRQQNHVPLLIVHPDIRGGQRCGEITSHLDLVPTIVGLTQKSTTSVADTMQHMKGRNLAPLLKAPAQDEFSKNRGGVLFCYSQLMVHDPAFTRKLYEVVKDKTIQRRDEFAKMESFPVDWSLRVSIRSITDGRFRFTRYFSFRDFNTPASLAELLERNDIELFDLKEDPDELNNLAVDLDRNKALILTMNEKLNALIRREIGNDDGRFLPLTDWINWDGARSGLLNV